MAQSKVSQARSRARQLNSRTGLALALLLGLGGCSVPNWANPVEWYRDTVGVSSGDPTGDERNTENLDQGGKQPYPNLASVPPAPTNALSAEERDNLRNTLSADQQNAKYIENSDQYVPKPPSAAPSPTSPQPPTPAAATPPNPTPAESPTPTPPTAAAAAAPPTPQQPAPAAPPPPQRAAAPPSQPQAPAAPPPPTQSARAPSAPTPAPSATPPQTASASPPSNGGSGTAIPQGSNVQRAPVRGSEAPPQESPLTPPQVRSVPQGETPRQAPPPPPSVRAPAPTPAPQPQPQQSASLPPPSSPTPPARSAAPEGGPAVTVTIGSVTLLAGNQLSSGDRDQLASIAQLRQQNGGTVHVTGYSVPGSGRDAVSQQMAGFGVALERAKAVAQALTQAGVPTQYVVVGAVPAPPGQSSSVVELSLEY